jgi:hypothetical protein
MDKKVIKNYVTLSNNLINTYERTRFELEECLIQMTKNILTELNATSEDNLITLNNKIWLFTSNFTDDAVIEVSTNKIFIEDDTIYCIVCNNNNEKKKLPFEKCFNSYQYTDILNELKNFINF